MKSNKVDVHYSHAAPYIREALVVACRQAADATTQRSRREYLGQAYAFARALEIMNDSGDQTPVEGVGGSEYHGVREYGYVRRFLGSDHEFEEVMGMPVHDPVPWPWEDR